MMKRIKNAGYKIINDNIDFRKQDCTDWYDCDIVLSIQSLDKKRRRFDILAVGDIKIYTKNNHFVFKGGKPSGELTTYLKKNGDWENNNWFEITENGEADMGDVFYELDSVIENLLERIEK